MKTRILIIGAALALAAGCATVGETALKAGTTGAVRFDPEDVAAAIQTAQASGDAVAAECFKAIRNHTAVEAGAVVKGIVSAYAAARVAARAARAPLAEDVHIKCSPLVVDAGTFASKLGTTFIGR